MRSIQHLVELNTVFNLYDAPYLLNPSSLNKEIVDDDPRRTRSFVKAQGVAKKVRQGQAGLTLRHTPDRDIESTFTTYGLDRSLLNPIPGRGRQRDSQQPKHLLS